MARETKGAPGQGWGGVVWRGVGGALSDPSLEKTLPLGAGSG